MPIIPEIVNSLFDYKSLELIGYKSKTITKEDIEAYKYVFSRDNALTGPINYYRANFSFCKSTKYPKPNSFSPGLYLLGERDLYIRKETGPMLQKQFKNLEFKIIEAANHFCQQDRPDDVNRLMREFLEKQH